MISYGLRKLPTSWGAFRVAPQPGSVRMAETSTFSPTALVSHLDRVSALLRACSISSLSAPQGQSSFFPSNTTSYSFSPDLSIGLLLVLLSTTNTPDFPTNT